MNADCDRMQPNSEKQSRRSIRLKGYDYTSSGAYFITICAYQRQRLFGKVVNGVMSVNKYGAIAALCWQEIPQHFPNVQLDEFVIMPNHMHGIVVIGRGMARQCPLPDDDRDRRSDLFNDDRNRRSSCDRIVQTDDGEGSAVPNPYERRFGDAIAGSIPTIVGSFKSVVTKRINQCRNTPGTPVWQRNYYEHIIRNEQSLTIIRNYVLKNPQSWQVDQLHPNHPSSW